MWAKLVLTAIMLIGLAIEVRAEAYPSDLLREAWFKAKWSAALKGRRLPKQDSWIRDLSGVAEPLEPFGPGYGSLEKAEICQPHNCLDNKLYILVDRRGRNVWALHVTINPNSRNYFGEPDSSIRKLLSSLSGATTSEAAQNPSQRLGNGTITGALSFPSDFLPPDLTVCAESNGQAAICTTRGQIDLRKGRYKLTLPAGTYLVYSMTSEVPGYKAYYSENVTCGLDASCPSHKPIPVTVPEGRVTANVDPQDWYKK